MIGGQRLDVAVDRGDRPAVAHVAAEELLVFDHHADGRGAGEILAHVFVQGHFSVEFDEAFAQSGLDVSLFWKKKGEGSVRTATIELGRLLKSGRLAMRV